MKDPLIIYIMGDTRSGSTLLDYLLSCHPKAMSVGELHHLHAYYMKNKGMGILYDWKCSCGEFVEDCNFWRSILENIHFSEDYKTRLKLTSKTKEQLAPSIRQTYFSKHGEIDRDELEKGREYAEGTWKIYREIRAHTGTPIVIDSSKDAFQAYFLNRYREGDIYFLHLERDIRAVAFSKYRRTRDLSPKIKRYWHPPEWGLKGYLKDSYRIKKRNRRVAQRIQRESKEDELKRIRYLELTKNPQKIINEICTFLDIGIFTVPKKTGESKGKVPHTICGSPSRYKQRPITPDTRWKKQYKKSSLPYIAGSILEYL